MDFRQLEYFVTAADKQSLSEAASALYTSQPHVSMVIRSLEQELNLALFDRTYRGVTLTEAGRQVYRYARNALKEHSLMQDLSAQKGKAVFSVITAPSSSMAALFADYYRFHDDSSCHYRFFEGGAEMVLREVSTGNAELGFVFVPEPRDSAFHRMLEQSRLTFTPLLDTDIVLYAGPHSRLYGRHSVTLEELALQKLIQNTDDFFSLSDLLPTDRRCPAPQPECVIRTNSDHAMIQLLQDSDLCNLGSYWLKDSFTRYGFCRLTIEGAVGRIHFGCVSLSGQPLSSAAEHFLSHVRQAIESGRP